MLTIKNADEQYKEYIGCNIVKLTRIDNEEDIQVMVMYNSGTKLVPLKYVSLLGDEPNPIDMLLLEQMIRKYIDTFHNK